MRRIHVPLAVVVAGAAVVAVPVPAGAQDPDDVPVQLLAMNDFHGRISLTSGGDSELVTAPGPDGVFGENELGESDDVVTEVGGSANVAATVQRVQAQFRQEVRGSAASFFVGAGDLISASPFESSVFKDEPTIEVLNAMGLDVSSVGNHEFDRGTEELRRISAATDGTFTDDVTACEGVTAGVDGCFGEGEHAFTGAEFPYLAANVLDADTGEPMLPPYQVFRTPTGLRMALIGVVFVTTPIMATFWFAGVVKTWYGGSMGSPVSSEMTFAARYGKSAPSNSWPSVPKQPSTPTVTPSHSVTSSVQVPSVAAEIRRSSSVPRSNSWLPTDEASSPMALRTSIVGSSL